MSTLEHELVEKIGRLNPDQQQKVLTFVQTLEANSELLKYSPSQIMQLPLEERNRLIAASFALAANEDFEIFEAFDGGDFDESPDVGITRGDIWTVRFDPGEGDEIRKIRPAVVVSVPEAGRIKLHIVVPITGWQPQFAYYFWMRHILPTSGNGLSKESAADTFQIASVSPNRFQRKVGVISAEEMREITSALALCIGYTIP